MLQQVKQYIDSLLLRVISDEVMLSQLSQQCEPSVSSPSGMQCDDVRVSVCVVDFTRCHPIVCPLTGVIVRSQHEVFELLVNCLGLTFSFSSRKT